MADRLVVLREGRVQQIGTPQELYDSPANWHVADFMGYQNLIDLKVTEVTGDRVIAGDGDVLVEGTPVGHVQVGDDVRVAIRPDDLQVVTAEQTRTAITGTVGVIEYQGKEHALTVQTAGGRTLHVRTPSLQKPGDAVRLSVVPERALVYPSELSDVELTPEERELEEIRG